MKPYSPSIRIQNDAIHILAPSILENEHKNYLYLKSLLGANLKKPLTIVIEWETDCLISKDHFSTKLISMVLAYPNIKQLIHVCKSPSIRRVLTHIQNFFKTNWIILEQSQDLVLFLNNQISQ